MTEIRTLTLNDVSELSSLEALCFSCPWSYESFLQCLTNDRFYFIGAFENEKLVGYGGILTVLDEGDVVNIAVHPDKRRRGIAKAILTELCFEAKNKGVILLHLEVRESNAGARSLYTSHGFHEDGIRKGYYIKPTENAVLMTLNLGK